MSKSRTVRGPIIVAIALSLAGVAGIAGGIWLQKARPVPGSYIDALALPNGVLAIRAERSGANSFAELWTDGHLQWRGLIPTYQGQPGKLGVRVTPRLVSIRVERGGQPANFDLDFASGEKRVSGALTVAQAETAFPPIGGNLPVDYDPLRRELRIASATRALPENAIAPQPYHANGGVLWIVSPTELTALSVATLLPVAAVR